MYKQGGLFGQTNTSQAGGLFGNTQTSTATGGFGGFGTNTSTGGFGQTQQQTVSLDVFCWGFEFVV